MILDAYVNTLFPQEKQKIKLYLSHFLFNSCFFFSKFDLSKYELLMHYMGISILVCMSFSCPDVTDKQKEMHIL